jgi:predicted ArsR family transcriptional regulator
MHGYAIGRWIEEATNCGLELEEGSLYPALYRMEKRGWLDAEWGTSELGRRAKFYRLTRADGNSSRATPRRGRRFRRRSIARSSRRFHHDHSQTPALAAVARADRNGSA